MSVRILSEAGSSSISRFTETYSGLAGPSASSLRSVLVDVLWLRGYSGRSLLLSKCDRGLFSTHVGLPGLFSVGSAFS